MDKTYKARVLTDGSSQVVQIPDELRLSGGEVSVRRDPKTGDLILSQASQSWDEIFAALDEAGIPDDFLTNRQ